jgi:hypothetical protein
MRIKVIGMVCRNVTAIILFIANRLENVFETLGFLFERPDRKIELWNLQFFLREYLLDLR